MFMTLRPMHDHPTWAPEFKNFHNIIYTPIDLPEPPEINWTVFNEWATRTHQEHMALADQRVTLPDGRSRRTLYSIWKDAVGEYPWLTSHAIKEHTSENENPWVNNFDKLFPELIEYLQLFPFFKLQSVNFLRQIPHVPVSLHTDPDNWLGFRFYILNTVNKDALYFRKVKKEYFNGRRLPTYRLDENLEPIKSDITLNDICEPERAYPDQKNSGRYPWALTSSLAAHGVDSFDADQERITCVVTGKTVYDQPGVIAGYKIKETLDLLERSTEKFKDKQIRYERKSN